MDEVTGHDIQQRVYAYRLLCRGTPAVHRLFIKAAEEEQVAFSQSFKFISIRGQAPFRHLRHGHIVVLLETRQRRHIPAGNA